MDPVSTTAITSLLVDYGRHLVGVAGDVLDAGIAKGLRVLWEKVRSHFLVDAQASGAFQRFAEQPDNVRRQAAVEDYLEELMQADADFAASLAELVEQVRSSGYANIRVRDAGAVAIGGDVTISGSRYAAGRDINLTEPGDDTPSVRT
jgi:hypothetical protein